MTTKEQPREEAKIREELLLRFNVSLPPEAEEYLRSLLSSDRQRHQEEMEKVTASKDGAYHERDLLVSALSKLFPAHLARHPDEDKEWEDDWRWIVFIELSTGQASWHIHDSERHLFDHLQVGDNNWDGHNNERKYQRLQALQALSHPSPKNPKRNE